MNKKELLNLIAAKTNLTIKLTDEVVNVLFEEISNAISIKESVRISGFGTFTTSDRSERDGVNPSTGEKIKIPAKVVPVFKASQILRDKVN